MLRERFWLGVLPFTALFMVSADHPVLAIARDPGAIDPDEYAMMQPITPYAAPKPQTKPKPRPGHSLAHPSRAPH